MGKRGPAPQPASITQLYGDNSGRPPKHQPPRIGGAPKMPDDLSENAKYFWKRTVPLLEQMHLVSESDWVVLEKAAVMYSRWRAAVDGGNDPRIKQYSNALLPLLKELGMTPNARLRMVVPPREEPKQSHVLD